MGGLTEDTKERFAKQEKNGEQKVSRRRDKQHKGEKKTGNEEWMVMAEMMHDAWGRHDVLLRVQTAPISARLFRFFKLILLINVILVYLPPLLIVDRRSSGV